MSKKKILVVEDEAIVAKDIEVCLKKIGYDYNVTLYLPVGLHIDGENVYTWNEKGG